MMGKVQPQRIIDVNAMAGCIISELFPEFSSCYLTAKFRHIERGLCSYLLEAKRTLEELRPEVVVNGYNSKEGQEI